MTAQPTVCCVCLTADRQALTDRAVRSFLAQDYENRTLLIWDTGKEPYDCFDRVLHDNRIALVRDKPAPIGKMRNDALTLLTETARATSGINEIICTFDSDDWSAPSRISDQVKLLQESGKQAVGYREMLFWRRHAQPATGCDLKGEAWLYTNTNPRYCVGTSLCFWRKTWEQHKFAECMIGEEREWLKRVDTLGEPARRLRESEANPRQILCPEMIAEIHGANTVKNAINAAPNCVNPDGTPYWRRVSEWDSRVREILEHA